MDQTTGEDWPSSIEQAWGRVIDECIEKDRQGVFDYLLSRVNTCGGGIPIAVDWGAIIEGAEFTMWETRIGALRFNAIDLGECIRLPHAAREHLACGDPHEINQRTFLHLCAGLECAMQKRPKRIPSRPRAEDLANCLRKKEAGDAQKMADANKESMCATDILSITQAVLTPRHDRDFRTICLPPSTNY